MGEGPPDQLPIFYYAVLTFEGTFKFRDQNIRTTKKAIKFLVEKAHSWTEKILAPRMRKGHPPDVGMGGAPEWLRTVIGPCTAA